MILGLPTIAAGAWYWRGEIRATGEGEESDVILSGCWYRCTVAEIARGEMPEEAILAARTAAGGGLY